MRSLGIPYLAKLPFKNEGEINTAPDQEKKNVASTSLLLKMSKFFRLKASDLRRQF